MKKMNEKIIFSTTDPEGRIIVLYENTLQHIKERHPEIKNPKNIKTTIQKPDFITQNTERKTLIYTTNTSIFSPYFNVYTKMDDKYITGQVSSAYLTREMPKGEIIWTDQS